MIKTRFIGKFSIWKGEVRFEPAKEKPVCGIFVETKIRYLIHLFQFEKFNFIRAFLTKIWQNTHLLAFPSITTCMN